MTGIQVKQSEHSLGLPDEFMSQVVSGLSQIEIERACIFGSAVEEGLEARDMDLLLISPDFAEIHYQSRKTL